MNAEPAMKMPEAPAWLVDGGLRRYRAAWERLAPTGAIGPADGLLVVAVCAQLEAYNTGGKVAHPASVLAGVLALEPKPGNYPAQPPVVPAPTPEPQPETAAPSEDTLLTLDEVAALGQISLRTVHRLVKTGTLSVIRPSPHAVRVRPADWKTYVAEKSANLQQAAPFVSECHLLAAGGRKKTRKSRK